MDALTLLTTRRSVAARNLTGPGPDHAALERILRIATRVPDHGKLTPWRIQVLRAGGQRALGRFLADLHAALTPEATPAQIAFEQAKIEMAPLLLVVTSHPVASPKAPEMEQLLSGGAVCLSILLAAHALGFGGSWVTGWGAYRPETLAFLGHDPAKDKILGLVFLGTPKEAVEDRPRPDLSDVVSEWNGPANAIV
jgi:nitroreductase